MAKEIERQDVLVEVKRILEDYNNFPEDYINEDSELAELGLDSLDALEISMDLEDIYDIDIEDDDIEKFETIGDMIDLVLEKLK